MKTGALIGFVALTTTGWIASLASSEPPDDRARAAARLEETVDLVFRHHVQPPARQQLILDLARSLLEAQGRIPPRDLAARASGAATREAARLLLGECLGSGAPRPQVGQAVRKLVRSLPGECQTIPAKEYNVKEQLAGNRYVGIGIVLTMQNQLPVVARVFPGGPLANAGGRDGDEILMIDSVDVEGMPLPEVVDRLRGPRDSEVRIMTRRGGKLRPVTLTRDVVPIRSVEGEEVLENGIAVVRITRLGASVAHELRQLEPWLREREVRGLILDLQSTQPGRVHDVKLLADALLPGGVIGAVDDEVFEAGPEAILPRLHLSLLVNHHTRGTAEWLAGSLQANGRAKIVGDFTRGEPWGTDGIPLPGEDAFLLLPTSILSLGPDQPLTHTKAGSTPAMNRIPHARWGVVPDVTIDPDFLNKSLEAGVSAETVLRRRAVDELRHRINGGNRPAA